MTSNQLAYWRAKREQDEAERHNWRMETIEEFRNQLRKAEVIDSLYDHFGKYGSMKWIELPLTVREAFAHTMGLNADQMTLETNDTTLSQNIAAVWNELGRAFEGAGKFIGGIAKLF